MYRVSPYRAARCHRFGIAAVPPADPSDLGCLKPGWHADRGQNGIKKYFMQYLGGSYSARMNDGAVKGHKTQKCIWRRTNIHPNDSGRSSGNLKF